MCVEGGNGVDSYAALPRDVDHIARTVRREASYRVQSTAGSTATEQSRIARDRAEEFHDSIQKSLSGDLARVRAIRAE